MQFNYPYGGNMRSFASNVGYTWQMGSPPITIGVGGTETYFNAFSVGQGRSEFLNLNQNYPGGFAFFTINTSITSIVYAPLYAASYNALSDYRIKTNVENLTASTTIDYLRPVKYLNGHSNKQEFGLIAHEVQEHYPSIVEGEKDGQNLQTVNYISLIPILIAEIQGLKRNITNLTTEVTNLKQQLSHHMSEDRL
jgi:hypothetical protein